MSLKLYNSLNREIENFVPIIDGKVGLYTCGPTVYDYSHIGNFRTFIFEDLLKRWLIHLGYDVNHIMNITDIDDKTIKKAKKRGVNLSEITNKYSEHFLKDLNWLKMIPANSYPKATDHIKDMVQMIEVLIDKDFAYCQDDGSVYFNIRSFSNYGILTRLKLSKQILTDRIVDDEYDKDNPQDFALWKAWKESDGDIYWDSPWRKGRPGSHIECSAMSTVALGDHFDIHCGGVDNMFPHHENEIAQSQCANDGPFVNIWLHSEHLMVDGGKMSKSMGNYYRISDLKRLGFTPECVRFQLLSGHYRSKINFSIEKKHEGDRIAQRVSEFYARLKKENASKFANNIYPAEYKEFRKNMNNDLDTPKSLAVFFDWMKIINMQLDQKSISNDDLGKSWEFLKVFDSIFGFIKTSIVENIPEDIQNILKKRAIARENNDWEKSDFLREALKKSGWVVEDTPEGQNLKKQV